MDPLICHLMNGPSLLLIFMANVFFTFCMVHPLQGERIKQPLKLVLWSLIFCTMIYSVTTALFIFTQRLAEQELNMSIAIYTLLALSMISSMTSSVWLNFLYYTQIVPAQRALFIWIKKNIKVVIFCIWVFDRLFHLFMLGLDISYVLNIFLGEFSHNLTIKPVTTYTKLNHSPLYFITSFIVIAYYIILLSVMVMSSGGIVVYLCRHMRRMAASGQPRTCSRIRGQMRVTVTGILQGSLYVLLATMTSYRYFTAGTPLVFLLSCANSSLINIYMLGTTFNLAVGQSVFRQRALDIWLRAAQLCKIAQQQQTEQEG